MGGESEIYRTINLPHHMCGKLPDHSAGLEHKCKFRNLAEKLEAVKTRGGPSRQNGGPGRFRVSRKGQDRVGSLSRVTIDDKLL